MNTYLRWTKIILIGLLVISIASCDRDTDDDRVEPSDITIVEPVPDDDRVEPLPNAAIVDIPDVSLREAIASELNIVDDTAITAEDMQKLTRLKCKEASVEDLFNQVLAVEQMLTSGGGWQDQVGGIVPGWKLTTTEPGMPQRFSVEQIVLAHDTSQALEEQLLLVYTGQQRVAKNILEQVVADWLSRREEMVATLTQLRSDAYLMRDALVAGDIEQFGNLLTRYWEGKKILNPDTTNPTIDVMLDSVSDLCYGYGITGAGGGGFLMLLAKNGTARSEIEGRLAQTQAIIYPWQVAT